MQNYPVFVTTGILWRLLLLVAILAKSLFILIYALWLDPVEHLSIILLAYHWLWFCHLIGVLVPRPSCFLLPVVAKRILCLSSLEWVESHHQIILLCSTIRIPLQELPAISSLPIIWLLCCLRQLEGDALAWLLRAYGSGHLKATFLPLWCV